ncbi:MAG: DUF1343 domain-containing protein, partial [Ruminiclostridium sp.]
CPFEVIGAPFIEGQRLAAAMNAKKLPGVIFRPINFKPFTSKFKDEECEGVQIHIADYNQVLSVDTSIELLYQIANAYAGQFEFLPPYKDGTHRFIDLLSGDDCISKNKVDKDELLADYKKESAEFAKYKQEFHLY